MKRKQIVIALLVIPLVLTIIAGAAIHWVAAEITKPTRRPLQDFHRKLLSEQQDRCLRIEDFTGSDGTPCLLVTPCGTPAQRGVTIRNQLTQRGHTLKPYGEVIGTLVLIHGRKGRKEDYLAVAERFCAAGFRCVIPDLPAHGAHPGSTATYGLREAKLPARILREASEKFGFNTDPSGLMGMSMGGSVAVHAAALDASPWRALAVIASFDALASSIHYQADNIAGDSLGRLWISAADALIQNRSGLSIYDIQPHRHAAHLTMPTLIAHGTADEVIPMDSAYKLFHSIPDTTRKQWIEIPNAGHDNILITDYPIYATIAGWMLSAMPERGL